MNARSDDDFFAKPGVTHVERASDRELVIRRLFRARPQLVFDAMTQPELLRRWWAPKSLGVELIEVHSDPRVGGTLRGALANLY